MKTVLPVLIAALALLMFTGLDAGEITVYKDQDGVINLTDRPAPAGAHVQQVIHYQKQSPAELEAQQAREEQRLKAADQAAAADHIRDLKEKAARASAEADKESALAREEIEAAEAYLERYKEKRRSQRRRHHKAAQRVAREAEEAQARANAAITRANQAQEEVRKASGRPTDQASDGQVDKEE